jgi:hypothetical protein
MAKRTPRSEAEDTTAAAAPARQQNPSGGGSRSGGESRSRARADRSQTSEATQEPAGTPDTFAARPAGEPAREEDQREDRSFEQVGGEPTEEEIRYRAYELYLERGGGHGMDFEDWVTAERELKNRR